MWIVKGILLGIGICLLGSIIYLVAMIYSNHARATGLSAFKSWTTQNPLYWTGCVLTLALGCGIVRYRGSKAKG